jgi:isopenicillin-N epimerase
MISIPIQTLDPEKLQRTLFLDYKIEVPIMRQGDDVYLRYSINAFNTVENLDALYNAIKEIQKQGILLK